MNDGLDGQCLLLQETLIDLAGSPIRLNAHFALQGADTGVVDVQRACAVVFESKQAHQTAIEVFGEGIECEQALGIADSSDSVLLAFKESEQVFECLLVALAE